MQITKQSESFKDKFINIGIETFGSLTNMAKSIDISKPYLTKLKASSPDKFNPSYKILTKFFELTQVRPRIFFNSQVNSSECLKIKSDITEFSDFDALQRKVIALSEALFESDYAFTSHAQLSKSYAQVIRNTHDWNPGFLLLQQIVQATDIDVDFLFDARFTEEELFESILMDVANSYHEAEEFLLWLDDIEVNHENVRILSAIHVKMGKLLHTYHSRN